ncbi:hypothetical protein BRD19_02360 [Halobacteriales archaeon SW_7_65_23]|nr:MAG: hypothetical protein BRD19_02360 [Halobacteriales archaeon SW_7_65_23]
MGLVLAQGRVLGCLDTKIRRDLVGDVVPVLDVLEADEFATELAGLVDQDAARDGNALAVAGEHGRNRRYQATSRVRARIEDELTTDVELLAEHQPELLDELREVVCENGEK